MQTQEQWLRGEVTLEEMLDDPIVRLMMESDGLDKTEVRSVVLAATARLKGRSKGHAFPAR